MGTKFKNFLLETLTLCSTFNEEQYDFLVKKYQKTFPFDSSIPNFKKIEISQELLSFEDIKSPAIPSLIGKMLTGDIYALGMYRTIFSDQKNMLVTYEKLHNDPILYTKYKEAGMDSPALAKITAEHWLNHMVEEYWELHPMGLSLDNHINCSIPVES